MTPVTPPVTPRVTPLPRAPATSPPVDPTLTSPTTPSLAPSLSVPSLSTPSHPIQAPDDPEQEVARLKAQLEALSRQLQEHRRDPTPADTGTPIAGRQTRKRPASQALQEALGIERESADEREARRVEKSTKKVRTMGGRGGAGG